MNDRYSPVPLVPAAASTSATELVNVGASTWAVLGFLGVACTGVAYVLYSRLVDDDGPARALVVTAGGRAVRA
jgi:drug/metabolite transporter (DMT)-like permease